MLRATAECTFFDIIISKTGPDLRCFVYFWLGNMLRATAACTFSTSQLPKVVPTWCVLYILTLKMCFAPQRRALFRHLNFQKWYEAGVLCSTFWLRHVLRATMACTFSTFEPPKVVRTWCVLYSLTWKCASRHNSVHFSHISTAKSGPDLRCFVDFHLKRCFAPQRRAFFNISTFKSVRTWCVLFNLTGKCASRHNGVKFFIAPVARWLGTRRFSKHTFRPSKATNHWKTRCLATFLSFRASISSVLLLFLFWVSFF